MTDEQILEILIKSGLCVIIFIIIVILIIVIFNKKHRLECQRACIHARAAVKSINDNEYIITFSTFQNVNFFLKADAKTFSRVVEGEEYLVIYVEDEIVELEKYAR
ncbi:hypothetical protein [Clostridium sp.]|uniref:hypothetical protein n=1 Tax=Clostridium sp. TaxID=1506 RepID=UPI001B3CB9ED|nr:hypothetical protein [Clostridium sp.]MBP3915612.1 hypothetical protein [Clostridium sp.]